MQTDTLSEVLKAVRLSGAVFIRARLSAPFGVTATHAEALREFFAPESDHALPFHLVTRGALRVDVEGADPLELGPGDIVALPHGATHTLRDGPGSEAVPAGSLEETGTPPSLVYGGGGAETDVLCGFFHCRGSLYNPLLQALPPVIVVRNDPDRTPWLAATLERSYTETGETRPAGPRWWSGGRSCSSSR